MLAHIFLNWLYVMTSISCIVTMDPAAANSKWMIVWTLFVCVFLVIDNETYKNMYKKIEKLEGRINGDEH